MKGANVGTTENAIKVTLEVRNRAALLALAEALGEIAADLYFDGEVEFPLTVDARREIVDK